MYAAHIHAPQPNSAAVGVDICIHTYAAHNRPAHPPTLLQVCQAESDVGQVWLVPKCMAQTPRTDTRIPTDQEQAATAAVLVTHQDTIHKFGCGRTPCIMAHQNTHSQCILANARMHTMCMLANTHRGSLWKLFALVHCLPLREYPAAALTVTCML